MATEADLKRIIDERLAFYFPRALSVLTDGKGNAAFPAGSSTAVDNMGLTGRLQRAVSASRTGKPNTAIPDPGKPKD